MRFLPLALILCSCQSPPPGPRFTVPTNQVLTPYGTLVEFPGRPVDVALSPDGRRIAVLAHRSIVIIDAETGAVRHQLKSRGKNGHSFAGIAFHGGRLYASSLNGLIEVIEPDFAFGKPIALTTAQHAPGSFAFHGDKLYVPLNTRNELWELENGEARRKFPVGIAPYAVVVSGERAFVSNWGGRRPKVRVDARDIAVEGSISVIDLAAGKPLAEIPVGPHAAGMVLVGDRLYVACANADEVAVIDTTSLAVVARIDVRPEKRQLFGSSPNAIATDGRCLYVSNGTNNAVAVVDIAAARTVGFIPTAWYPAGLLFDAARKRLVVANLKGRGSWDKKRERGWNSYDYLGSVSLMPLPDDLEALTARVVENHSLSNLEPPRAGVAPRPVPERHGEPSVFEHVIYIIKENRTYDQVLGDMPEGDGDPKLCEFPESITPNHHALAREFVLLDRFFCCGVLSADGHQWTDEAFVTDYVEKFFGGWVRSYPFDGGDPLAYAPSGFLWDNALARGKSVRVYGEFVGATIKWRDGRKEAPTFKECWEDYKSGAGKIEIRATAKIKSLEPHICPTAIGFPMRVSDQYRADQFLAELNGGRLENLSIILLPADHTAGTTPGMPTPRACVADNDLALGRIVEAVSKSRFWPKTCILVVEDDPQGGFDHVDGRRTIAFAVSPYTRRRAVVHTEYNQVSMVRTIELMLGLPPMNQMDAGAVPMGDCFTDVPDLTPYRARSVDIALDELNAKLDDIRDPAQRHWAERSMELALENIDEADEDTLNRIIWHAMKGWHTRYPAEYALVGDDDD